ncbi:MAG: polymerase subunit delta, partial [Micromonosporaceae bacterium]|nr:polymerase subunit delta [Micromonosporaceae bacterium]
MRWVVGGVTRDTMAAVPPPPHPIQLVLGDEDVLVARAVNEAVATVRAAEPDAELREYLAGDLVPGELAEMLSP